MGPLTQGIFRGTISHAKSRGLNTKYTKIVHIVRAQPINNKNRKQSTSGITVSLICNLTIEITKVN